MSLNPRLQTEPVSGKPMPAFFTGETFILSRDGLELEFELPYGSSAVILGAAARERDIPRFIGRGCA
eukprot:1180726-Prorocentrum_minimum.AAC.2